eukprot:m.27595 g.27595  ORF g.27595 m.27595 type:complete len:279 (+) comp8948_c0_seq1:217-1053(+)
MEVLMKDEAGVKAKIAQMKADGVSHFQVIADFDFTLTRFRLDDGERSNSCHAAIETCACMSKEYQEKTHALFTKYYPIEVSDIPDDEKERAMIEWWTQGHAYMVEHKFRREYLASIANAPRLVLREGVPDMLHRLHASKIPMHIFSAGLYDVIHSYLSHHQLDHLAHVVSNMMVFDDSGLLTGFQGTLIHTMNKNSTALRNSAGWPDVASRKNILLLGDNIGDVHMSKGLEGGCQIKVGFLNDRVEERRDAYMDAYDVVLVGDAGVQDIDEILSQILD